MIHERQTEFLVVGAGPAGSAAAMCLANAGRDVVLIERSHFTRVRIGETLPAAIKPLLLRLGISLNSIANISIPSPGTACCWGHDSLSLNDSIFDPDGDGLHIDRAAFDKLFATSAASAGATLLQRSKLESCLRCHGGWVVSISGAEGIRKLRALQLIDATGRYSWTGRPSQREKFDRQIAFVGIFDARPNAPAFDHRTWIEATESGWWYSAAIPGQRLVAAFFSDFDLVFRTTRNQNAVWEKLLGESSWMRERLQGAALSGTVRVVPASSTLASPIVLERYVAVGDAASTIDPLSSQGILYALMSGAEAADALINRVPRKRLEEYANGIRERFQRDLQTRTRFCLKEMRWPDSPFWRRRHQSPTVVDSGKRAKLLK